MIKQNLATEISDYISQAAGLEATRFALVERIVVVVKAEIIPEIIPLLPHGYSIDSGRVEVSGIGGEPTDSYSNRCDITYGSVPTGFCVSRKQPPVRDMVAF